MKYEWPFSCTWYEKTVGLLSQEGKTLFGLRKVWGIKIWYRLFYQFQLKKRYVNALKEWHSHCLANLRKLKLQEEAFLAVSDDRCSWQDKEASISYSSYIHLSITLITGLRVLKGGLRKHKFATTEYYSFVGCSW